MKYFHGTVQGNGGKSTNSGTMSSGLKVEAHSKQGTVIVQLSETSGMVNARIYLTKNPLTGKGTERILFDGPVSGYNEPDVVIRMPSRATRQVTMPDPEILTDEQVTQPFVDFFNLPSAGTDPAQLEAERRTAHAFAVKQQASILPPVQRRTQPEYSYRPGVVDRARLLTGPIFATGNDMDQEEEESTWDNDTREGHGPRVSFGKLRILPDADD